MTGAPLQGTKGTRKPRPILWVRATSLERAAARRVAKAEGLARGELLRRYSLNEVVRRYRKIIGRREVA